MVQLAISKQGAYGTIHDSLLKIKVTKTQIINGDTTVIVFDSMPPRTDAYLQATYEELNKESIEVKGILGLKGIPKKSDTASCSQSIAYYDGLIKNAKDESEREKLRTGKQKAYIDCLKETKSKSPYQHSFFMKLIGWLLTALAISLGAPFWFDLLNKFVKLRESGPKQTPTALQDRPATAAAAGIPIKGSDNKEIKG